MKIIVPSYSKTYWCLKPFAYLFNKYWERETAVVLHYPKIPFDLPNNFELYQVYYKDYPKKRWADGVIEYLEKIDDIAVVLLLEDYWLVRKVNKDAIRMLNSVIENNDKLLRIDLTTDRLYAGGMRDVGYIEWVDLIEAPNSQYQMSLQAGIWNRKNLLKVLYQLKPEERSSWDVELRGTSIINDSDLRVFGTRQAPVRYENGVNVTRGVNKELKSMPPHDRKNIMKWIGDK